MANESGTPMDFEPLNDMYLTVDQYSDLVESLVAKAHELSVNAWHVANSQSQSDIDAYLKKCVIAQWRDFELDYLLEIELGQNHLRPFREYITLKKLDISDLVDEDFLALSEVLSQEAHMKLVAEASASWCQKYNVRLEYSSEIQFPGSGREIFIDPIPA